MRRLIPQGLMQAFRLVQQQPPAKGRARLRKAGEVVWPDTLFFYSAKKPFNHAVLVRGTERDKLLSEPIGLTGLTDPPILKERTNQETILIGASRRLFHNMAGRDITGGGFEA